jgi:alanine dehydrogenase
MRIGIPKETKVHEYRVSMTPPGVRELTNAGHEVLVQSGAGDGSAISDGAFRDAGASIRPTAAEVWGDCDMVLKVKEPIEAEFEFLRPGLLLFTYLHLAASVNCTQALLNAEVTALAYETVRLDDGALPLLAPMSEIAGRLAPQVGAQYLTNPYGGRGLLLGGCPGVAPANVVILGAGVAGRNAVAMAVGLHADVTVLDVNVNRLTELDHHYAGRVKTVRSSALEVERAVAAADLVIGAVLIAGSRAPVLVSNDLVSSMSPGSVLVDIAIDQGGCFEDSRPTDHAHPTYSVHGSLMYCVTNMPGSVARTSTYALTNATMPYVLQLAALGWRDATSINRALAHGLNIHAGHISHPAIAEAHPTLPADLGSVHHM